MKTLFLSIFFLLGFCGSAFCHPIDMDAIAQIESSNTPTAKGKHGEIGLFQITPICLKHFNQVNSERKNLGWFMRHDGQKISAPFTKEMLSDSEVNEYVANWYMNWLFDRCLTVKDTIIAWNWGIGNWRKWHEAQGHWMNAWISNDSDSTLEIITRNAPELPKTTQAYLKKYEQITGEVLA